MQQPDNPVAQLFDKVQAHHQSECVVVLVRPQSVKFYRTVRNLAGPRSIDVRYDPVDADVNLESDEARKALAVPVEARKPTSVGPPQPPSPGPTPRPSITSKRSVFFECRGNKLFFVDKDGLDAQIAKLLPALRPNVKDADHEQFLKAIQGQEIGNENYKVDLSNFLFGRIALIPRPDAPGDNRDQLEKPDGKFQTALSQLDPKEKSIAFLVRDDSFDAFRGARSIAEKRGFDTGWDLLGPTEPIKFGE